MLRQSTKWSQSLSGLANVEGVVMSASAFTDYASNNQSVVLALARKYGCAGQKGLLLHSRVRCNNHVCKENKSLP